MGIINIYSSFIKRIKNKEFFILNRIVINPICKVFTKEYKQETEYYEFLDENIDSLKLESNNQDIDERINILRDVNFVSDFKINSLDSSDHIDELKIRRYYKR